MATNDDFAAFYESSRTRVFRAACLALGDSMHAEEAVAEAFARAFQRWDRLQKHPNKIGWVTLTALNHHRSWWRRHKREQPAVSSAVAASVPTTMSSPDMLDPTLIDLLRQLPESQRRVLALRVLLDFSTRSTATTLGISEGTVKAHLHRALKTLRELMLEKEVL